MLCINSCQHVPLRKMRKNSRTEYFHAYQTLSTELRSFWGDFCQFYSAVNALVLLRRSKLKSFLKQFARDSRKKPRNVEKKKWRKKLTNTLTLKESLLLIKSTLSLIYFCFLVVLKKLIKWSLTKTTRCAFAHVRNLIEIKPVIKLPDIKFTYAPSCRCRASVYTNFQLLICKSNLAN